MRRTLCTSSILLCSLIAVGQELPGALYESGEEEELLDMDYTAGGDIAMVGRLVKDDGSSGLLLRVVERNGAEQALQRPAFLFNDSLIFTDFGQLTHVTTDGDPTLMMGNAIDHNGAAQLFSIDWREEESQYYDSQRMVRRTEDRLPTYGERLFLADREVVASAFGMIRIYHEDGRFLRSILMTGLEDEDIFLPQRLTAYDGGFLLLSRLTRIGDGGGRRSYAHLSRWTGDGELLWDSFLPAERQMGFPGTVAVHDAGIYFIFGTAAEAGSQANVANFDAEGELRSLSSVGFADSTVVHDAILDRYGMTLVGTQHPGDGSSEGIVLRIAPNGALVNSIAIVHGESTDLRRIIPKDAGGGYYIGGTVRRCVGAPRGMWLMPVDGPLESLTDACFAQPISLAIRREDSVAFSSGTTPLERAIYPYPLNQSPLRTAPPSIVHISCDDTTAAAADWAVSDSLCYAEPIFLVDRLIAQKLDGLLVSLEGGTAQEVLQIMNFTGATVEIRGNGTAELSLTSTAGRPNTDDLLRALYALQYANEGEAEPGRRRIRIIPTYGCRRGQPLTHDFYLSPTDQATGPGLSDTSLCAATSIVLNGRTPTAQSYRWSTGDTSPQITVATGGVYTLTTTYACGTVTDTLTVGECCRVYLPTAFSPNGDGRNDLFAPLPTSDCPMPLDGELSVFDRWGGLVFKGTNGGWDGSGLSGAAGPGAYTYVLEYFNGVDIIRRTGAVILLR